MSELTRSERVFAQYVTDQGFDPVRIAETARKEPDYYVDVHGERVFFEIKEFGRPEPLGPGGHSPLPYVKRKIKKAREQFDQYQGRCCCLVLYNHESIALSLSPYLVLSAMFGEYYQRHPNDEVVFS